MRKSVDNRNRIRVLAEAVRAVGLSEGDTVYVHKNPSTNVLTINKQAKKGAPSYTVDSRENILVNVGQFSTRKNWKVERTKNSITVSPA